MILQAILAYIHYLSIIILIVTLVLELVIFEKTLSRRDRNKLQKVDSLYGLSAILILATGTLRIMLYGKGWSYYLDNYFFVVKLSLFLIVGLLSIYPTISFLRWRKLPSDQEDFSYNETTFKKIRAFIRMEVVLAFLIPLFAALMARGVGF